MSFRRVGGGAGAALAVMMWVACGQVYRPVVIPCTSGELPGCPVQTPAIPSNFHEVFGVTNNVSNYPGGAMEIDVSGDTIIAETPTSDASAPNLGDNPTYAAILYNDSKVFVAAAGSIYSGQNDSVASFIPATQFSGLTGFSIVNSVSLPAQTAGISAISESGGTVTVTLSSALTATAGYAIAIAGVNIPNCVQPACNPFAYNGTFPLVSVSGLTLTYTNSATGLAAASGGTASVPLQPDFLATTENTAMYVANYNANSVMTINPTLNVVTNSATVGANPVAMAETPIALASGSHKLYVANQGSNSVSSLNTLDLSSNTVTGFTGVNPVWVTVRSDSQKVYVLTQGDGQLETIDVATDTVVGSSAVGAGANFILFDPNLNRLYVINPVTGTVYVFSDTGGANDTPVQLAAISMSSSALCTAGCTAVVPVSVTALPDGSRFYVASYQVATACPDTMAATTGTCVIPGLTVFDAQNFAVQYPTAPTLTLLTDPPFNANLSTNQFQYAVPLVSSCGPATVPVATALYAPGATRFRVFTVASVDGSRVYMSMCDAGVIAVIDTQGSNLDNTGGTGTPADTVVTDLPAAFSAGAPQANGLPPNQSPIFLLTGQ
jgi:DNA-binding beta-propeller fold protein YncE